VSEYFVITNFRRVLSNQLGSTYIIPGTISKRGADDDYCFDDSVPFDRVSYEVKDATS
jgi:hypothetical protein